MISGDDNNIGRLLFSYGASLSNLVNQRIDDGGIYRVAATADTLQNRGFINGTTTGQPTAASRPTPGTSSSASTLIYIGRGAGASTSGVRMLNGHIRNLRIWHRALTDNQIKGLR